MVTAIVLINVERPILKQVIQDILGINGVTEVYPVAGEYDLVAMVRVNDNKELSDIVADKMPHHINGIVHTKTLIALDAHSKIDLQKAFGLA
jgi:DNA-binding Lrp family transcriptional regulator